MKRQAEAAAKRREQERLRRMEEERQHRAAELRRCQVSTLPLSSKHSQHDCETLEDLVMCLAGGRPQSSG